MAGISHYWNGTVLTITSDSGTSAADLKGEKGDDGARGPQGLPGDCNLLEAVEQAQAAAAEAKEAAANNLALIKATRTGEVISTNETLNKPLQGLTIYGKTTQDGTPTPDSPIDLVNIAADGAIGVKVCGKNQLKNIAVSKTVNGITFTVNDNGSITVNGTNTGTASATLVICEYSFIKDKQYILSGLINSNAQTIHIWTQSTTAFPVGSRLQCYNGAVMRTAAASEVCSIRIQVEPGAVINNITVYPMLQLASITDTTYEPYKESGTLTINTPNGLPGIPVSSGGNYTDSTGQQWYSDEVDLEKGVYIQKVDKIVFDGTETWYATTTTENGYRYDCACANALQVISSSATAYIICSHYKAGSPNASWLGNDCITVATSMPEIMIYDARYKEAGINAWKAYLAAQYAAGTPITAIYAIATPIETALTAEEIEAYKALYSLYPYTTFYTDSNAGIAATYIADTKTYIDNKYEELTNAIISLGGNV